MPASYCAGKDGAITLAAGNGNDFMSFGITENQAVESVAAYGSQVYEPYRGSGTPHQEVDVAAFAKYGAANTSPGFGSSSGLASPGGGTATFTPGTGVTLTGPYVISQLTMQHSRIRAIAPLTYHLHNSGEVVTTWPVS